MKLKHYKVYDDVVKRMWLDYDIRQSLKKQFEKGNSIAWIDGTPISYKYYLSELLYPYDRDDKQKKIFEYVG